MLPTTIVPFAARRMKVVASSQSQPFSTLTDTAAPDSRQHQRKVLVSQHEDTSGPSPFYPSQVKNCVRIIAAVFAGIIGKIL